MGSVSAPHRLGLMPFVDSSLTPGIQIADGFAYVTRLNYENRLIAGPVPDPYFSAIQRYAAIVREKTRNYERGNGLVWYGITTMDTTRFQYEPPEPALADEDAAAVSVDPRA